MRIGVDYYPEHWPRERWEQDVKLMKKANLQVIRIAEFSWSLSEKSDGEYDFSWLDEAVEFYGSNGISIVMSTPTAAPPKWLVDKYPQILQKDRYGQVKGFGSRRHYCSNSGIYTDKSLQIVEQMAKRYGNNKYIEGWQIDNEFGNQDSVCCYCEECEAKFREWLKAKYITIEELNRKYGTVVWSQIYNSFDEVILPRAAQCENDCPNTKGLNPSLFLDYKRFASESVIAYQNKQIDMIKKYTAVPVTSNLMGTFHQIDYYKLAAKHDFLSWDNYIDTEWGVGSPSGVSLGHSVTRGLKKEAPMWIMEQQSGPCGWTRMGNNPAPGKLRLWTYQSFANGADTVVYFRFRAALFGTEEYWFGILNHDGRENRRFEEIAKIGEELDQLNRKIGRISIKSKVAILRSFEDLWSHSIHTHSIGFDYGKMIDTFYRQLFKAGVNTDVISPKEELSAYDYVLAPALNLCDDRLTARLENYVKNGGKLVLTYRSGTKTFENTMHELTVPGKFSDLLGITALDFDPLGGNPVMVSSVFGNGTASIWADVVSPVTAGTIGKYSSNYYAGSAFATENDYGKGKAYYLGTQLNEELTGKFLNYIGIGSGLLNQYNQDENLEIRQITLDRGDGYFVLNHGDVPIMIKLDNTYTDYVTGKTDQGVLELDPYGVAILLRP